MDILQGVGGGVAVPRSSWYVHQDTNPQIAPAARRDVLAQAVAHMAAESRAIPNENDESGEQKSVWTKVVDKRRQSKQNASQGTRFASVRDPHVTSSSSSGGGGDPAAGDAGVATRCFNETSMQQLLRTYSMRTGVAVCPASSMLAYPLVFGAYARPPAVRYESAAHIVLALVHITVVLYCCSVFPLLVVGGWLLVPVLFRNSPFCACLTVIHTLFFLSASPLCRTLLPTPHIEC